MNKTNLPQSPFALLQKTPARPPVRQTMTRPVTPPVYRPQPVPKVLQPKGVVGQRPPSGQQPPRHPAAPHAYRPEPKRVVQPKASSATSPKHTDAPPVYRTRPAPSASHAKGAAISNARDVVQRIRVYRMGSGTDSNLCPRPGIDDTAGAAGRGLSTSTVAGAGKAQIIETNNLGADLEAVNDHGNHYAIRPTNDADNAKLTAWAATRAAGGHACTNAVRAAIVATRNAQGVDTDV